MKKFFLLIQSIVFINFIQAQTIYTTSQNYQYLKENNQLKQNAKYQILPLTASPKTTIKNNDVSLNLSAAKTNSTNSCQCLMPLDATFTVVPMSGYTPPSYRNDDGSSSLIPLGFNFCFYGTNYNSCYINNNGNITFNSALFSFSAGGFPAGNPSNLDTIMIAPFWGDVDTRNASSGLVYYKKTATSMIIKWSNVGYYNSMADKVNDFQLIITDGTDPILPNGNNVAFCYGDMQWTTGAASSGVGGFGGIAATAGVNKGDNTNYIQLGRFDQAGSAYDGPYGLNDGISFLDNKSYFFNTCGSNNNLPPIIQDATGGGSACGDTIKICSLGDTLVYTTTFLAPEMTQSITVNYSAPTLGTSFQPLSVTTSSAGTTAYTWMVVASASLTGVHTLVITGTDNGTPPLSSSATYFIKIENLSIPQPTLASSPAGTVCATPGATLNLTNCSDYDNVYWRNGASGCSTIANTTGVYFVTVKKTGCYKSSSDTIEVFPNPTPIVVGPMNYCPPATSTTLSVAPTSTNVASYTSFTWTPGAVNTNTASLNGTLAGKPYTLTVTDANGCSGSTTFTVSTATPTVGITANPTSLCGTGTVTLTASISGATSYSWSNGASTQTTSVNTGGVHSVTVNANNCVATKTINVSINPTPTVSIPSNLGMCSGANATVTTTNISPTGAYSYTWSNGSNASSIVVSTATVVTVQVTNISSGCVSVVSNTCNIVAASNPTVSLPLTPVVFCNGSNATLTPTVTGGSPAYNYTWNPSSLGNASTATTSTQSTFSVLVQDANLCVGSATVSTTQSSPSVTLTSNDLIICPGECSIIHANIAATYTPVTYSWSNNTTADSVKICQSGVVTVTMTDAVNCTSTNSITVVDDIIPIASFTATPPSPVTPGQTIDFTSTSTISSGSITSSVWTFGNGDGSSGVTTSYSYSNPGTYDVILIVTGSTGCMDTAVVSYVVDAVLEIPNVFTPNGDNANDLLKFKNLEVFGDNHLIIFNRWGKKLFEQENYKNNWDGGNHTDGTYFFILNVPKATPNHYEGYIQLIK